MAAKSSLWPYHISNTISTTTHHLNDSKRKRNGRSKSMFEWPLSIHSNNTCFSPTIMTAIPSPSRRPDIDQQNHYSSLISNDESVHVYSNDIDQCCHINNDRENSNGDFLFSSVDDEKNGLSPISTSISITSSLFRRPLKNELQHYYHDDDNDGEDIQKNKLPIRSWSLKQQSFNDHSTTMQCIQRFLTQFVKVFVSSGAPSHRLDTCTRLLLRKWNMAAQFGYFPGFMIISFENPYGKVLSK
jgi:hypothetical protein